jgi:hypothetical protein
MWDCPISSSTMSVHMKGSRVIDPDDPRCTEAERPDMLLRDLLKTYVGANGVTSANGMVRPCSCPACS